MRTLPTISQVMSMVRQESAGARMTKQASTPDLAYISEIARGLHEVAEIVKSASATQVTYDDVSRFSQMLLRGGSR